MTDDRGQRTERELGRRNAEGGSGKVEGGKITHSAKGTAHSVGAGVRRRKSEGKEQRAEDRRQKKRNIVIGYWVEND